MVAILNLTIPLILISADFIIPYSNFINLFVITVFYFHLLYRLYCILKSLIDSPVNPSDNKHGKTAVNGGDRQPAVPCLPWCDLCQGRTSFVKN